MKQTIRKPSSEESMLDDLLDDTNRILMSDERMDELGPEARAALDKLSHTVSESGRPIAIILFWHTTHCMRCSTNCSHPKYNTGAMLKRWFARKRIFQYEPIIEHTSAGYAALPRRIETSHSDITCCAACFERDTAVAQISEHNPFICRDCGGTTHPGYLHNCPSPAIPEPFIPSVEPLS